jgi:hypothetical protein
MRWWHLVQSSWSRNSPFPPCEQQLTAAAMGFGVLFGRVVFCYQTNKYLKEKGLS